MTKHSIDTNTSSYLVHSHNGAAVNTGMGLCFYHGWGDYATNVLISDYDYC